MGINIRSLTSNENEDYYRRTAFLFSRMYDFMNNVGLVQQLVPNGEDIWINTIKKSLGKLNNITVAIEDDLIIGFAAGNIRLLPNYLGSKKVGYISHVFVDPEFRKKMIGKELLKGLESWFAEKNVSLIELEVLYKNRNALIFWERSGYVMDSYRMIKKI